MLRLKGGGGDSDKGSKPPTKKMNLFNKLPLSRGLNMMKKSLASKVIGDFESGKEKAIQKYSRVGPPMKDLGPPPCSPSVSDVPSQHPAYDISIPSVCSPLPLTGK